MNANPKQKTWPDHFSPVKIVNNPDTKRSVDSSWTHGGLCWPSGQNLIMAKERERVCTTKTLVRRRFLLYAKWQSENVSVMPV